MASKSHKDIAVDFLTLVTEGKIREAYEQYAIPTFFHHNPNFKGDKESLAVAMEENHKLFPHKVYTIKHVLEDGDLVAVHGHVELVSGGKHAVVVHICRFEDDKIAELWDIGEVIPDDSPNENGFF